VGFSQINTRQKPKIRALKGWASAQPEEPQIQSGFSR
jgi:hypothetical protein